MKNFALVSKTLIALSMCGASLLTAACTDEDGNMSVDAGMMADATPPPIDAQLGWAPLLGRTWSSGYNQYKCVRIRTTSDLYLKGFRSTGSEGQYRLWLTVSNEDNPHTSYGNPEEWDCNPGSGSAQLEGGGMYESTTGTGEVNFPAGMGFHVKAGDYITMHIQLRNSPTTLTGSTQVEANFGTAADVIQPLTMIYAGKFSVTVPNNVINYSLGGGCTLPSQMRVIGVMPRLDSMGLGVALSSTQNGEKFATSFSSADRPYFPLAQEIVFNAGDQLRVDCRFANFTGSPGTSPAQNCALGMYVYPRPMATFIMNMCLN